jgi:HPt (histidine-containing phosphotransfer) domain-containing protein
MSETPTAAQEQTNKLIAELWIRNQPLILARLDLLDAAARAAKAGTLDESQRAEAESTAHKLSGSLGMFGYDDGTILARSLEAELQLSAPDAGRVFDLSNSLRAVLFPKAE